MRTSAVNSKMSLQDSTQVILTSSFLSYVGSIASKLGRKPTKEETIGYRYIKSRLGNWPGIMVKLGLLEPKSVRRERVRRSIADKQKNRSNKN